MASHNEILEGGLNNSLVKRLAMAGGSPAPVLEPGIFPTINLGVAWEELAFNQGWRRWQSAMRQTAVAAEKARFLLVNPTGSGVLCVIEQIWLSTLAISPTTGFEVGMNFGYGTSAAFDTPDNLGSARDTRQTPSGAGTLRTSFGTDAAALGMLGAAFELFGASTYPVMGGPWLLWSGGLITIGSQVDNVGMTMNTVWSERGMTRNEQLG